VGIYPGYNATVSAVEVSSGSRVGLGDSPGIRSIPLPLISVNAVSPGSGYGDAPSPTPLSPEAARAVNSLIQQRAAPRFPEKTPRVFDEDLEPPSGGEEYALRSIAQGPFRSRDWPVCRDELVQYLSLPRSAASESKARFYLAQACYFTGSYREALFEFLAVQSDYPEETAEWIQAALAMLTQ
jgi:TolA-binding protein